MQKDTKWLLEEKYKGEKTEAFFADCARLEKGEPLAYVIGHIPFLDTVIYLDSHPLIPRPETEFWVSEALKEVTKLGFTKPYILDLCAGSGCIGVATLKALPEARVDFVEIETTHHPTILKNVEGNGIESDRVRILGGDVYECVTEKYDVLFVNPPYIDPDSNHAQETVKAFEPEQALYGGTDGMDVIERVIIGSREHTRSSSLLYIEHEPEQASKITAMAAEYGFDAETRKDQYGVLRYTVLTRQGEK